MNEPQVSGHCDKVLLVQAEFDGELDAAQAAALAAVRRVASNSNMGNH